jgi:hypothetical protein
LGTDDDADGIVVSLAEQLENGPLAAIVTSIDHDPDRLPLLQRFPDRGQEPRPGIEAGNQHEVAGGA